MNLIKTTYLAVALLSLTPKTWADVYEQYGRPPSGYQGAIQTLTLGAGFERGETPMEAGKVGIKAKVSIRRLWNIAEGTCLTDYDWILNTSLEVGATGIQIPLNDDPQISASRVNARIIPLSISRVNCFEKNPLNPDRSHFSALVFPIRVTRNLFAGKQLGVVVSLVGLDWTFATAGKDQFTQDDEDAVRRYVSRLVIEAMSVPKLDTSRAYFDDDVSRYDTINFRGIHFFRAELEQSLRSTFGKCANTATISASADFSGGTTGILKEYGIGGKISHECGEPKSNLNIYSLSFDSVQWSDDEFQRGSDSRMMLDYTHQF